MHAILTAMSEATRVEQSIEHTERVQFDLSELVRNMGQAYRQSFPTHRIETLVPPDALHDRRLARPDRTAARQAHGQRHGLHAAGRTDHDLRSKRTRAVAG